MHGTLDDFDEKSIDLTQSDLRSVQASARGALDLYCELNSYPNPFASDDEEESEDEGETDSDFDD